MAEMVLGHINETIREQEGKERLKDISKDLWVGQGYVTRFIPMSRKRTLIQSRLQAAGSHCADAIYGTQEAPQGRDSHEGKERA